MTQGFGHRVRRAWYRWASQQSEAVKYEDFGVALARAELPSRAEPYVPTTISEWVAERSEPKARTYRAMAAITGFREGWLMSGELPEESEAQGTQGAVVEPPEPQTPRATHREVHKTDLTASREKGQPVKKKPGRSAMAG